MINLEKGKVVALLEVRGEATELLVRLGKRREKALNYNSLTGPVFPGDTVEVNTSAVRLGLGTGGYHFIYFNYRKPRNFTGSGEVDESCKGHIMKLRYTPQQLQVNSCEEGGKQRKEIEGFTGLNGSPVIIGELHSMVAAAALCLKQLEPDVSLSYVMTDSASLPLALSCSVERLRRGGFLGGAITCGQAFGGDLEAVNVYTGLIAAFRSAASDMALLFPGPGVVGTGTRYGFSGMEVGENVNRVISLGGTPVVVPRLSFADPRGRHRGISHHTLTSLTMKHVQTAYLPLPILNGEEGKIVAGQIEEYCLQEKHNIRLVDANISWAQAGAAGIPLRTMGRGPEEDPAFFQAVAAAAKLAEELRSESF